MNLLTGWDELICSNCQKKLGRIYVSDDWGLEVQCNECEKKEIEK
jgi:DNA-directed RNA polymerase subunit RPC12/RpoP